MGWEALSLPWPVPQARSSSAPPQQTHLPPRASDQTGERDSPTTVPDLVRMPLTLSMKKGWIAKIRVQAQFSQKMRRIRHFLIDLGTALYHNRRGMEIFVPEMVATSDSLLVMDESIDWGLP